MPTEDNKIHSKGSALQCREEVEIMPYTDVGKTEIKLALITGLAKRESDIQFLSLAHILDKDFLGRCFSSLNRNKAKGLDNIGWYEYEEKLEENLTRLVSSNN